MASLGTVSEAFSSTNYHPSIPSLQVQSSTMLHIQINMKNLATNSINTKRLRMNLNRLSRNCENNLRKDVKSGMDSTMSSNLPSSSPSLGNRFKNMFQHLVYKMMRLSEVGKWRVAAAAFITSIIAFSPFIDMQLINLWSWLQTDTVSLLPRMFRHDHWEWMVAVWAFFFWIHGYWLVDRSIAKADAKGLVHKWKKYRLQDQFEAEKFRRMQLRRLEENQNGEISSDDMKKVEQMKPPTTRQHKWHLGFWIFELPLYCLPLYIWDICIPRRAAKIASWGAPTAFKICSDVSCALLLYDLGFFLCHYLMHKIPFLYKYVHAKHHTSTEVRASDIVRLVRLYLCYFFPKFT